MTDGSQGPTQETLFDYKVDAKEDWPEITSINLILPEGSDVNYSDGGDSENSSPDEDDGKMSVDGFHKLREAMWFALIGDETACYTELINMTHADVKASYRGMNVLLSQLIALGAAYEFQHMAGNQLNFITLDDNKDSTPETKETTT